MNITFPLLNDEAKLSKLVVDAVQDQNNEVIISSLQNLEKCAANLPKSVIGNYIKAILNNDWKQVSIDFINHSFMGKNDEFLMLAPYKTKRLFHDTIKLTAIYGQKIDCTLVSNEMVEEIINSEFGEIRQSCPQILPFQPFEVAGGAGRKAEAFNVASNFVLNDSHLGPSFNNMSLQRQRFNEGRRCIRKIFSPETAEYLLGEFEIEKNDTKYRIAEYHLHDCAHGTGLGLNLKTNENLLINPWDAAVEESRSDGISLKIAIKLLPPQEAALIIAMNICVRLGLDTYRNGGINRDADVIATMLNFAHWWDSNELDIKQGKLHLKHLSSQGLIRLVDSHCNWATRLTHQELQLDYPTGLSRLYGCVAISSSVESIFKGLVLEPCQDFFQDLN